MKVIVVVIFVIFGISIAILQNKNHKRKITARIKSMGGEIIGIEKKVIYTGPFVVVGKGRTVYRIKYKRENEVKEGWVKFGDLGGPDWIL